MVFAFHITIGVLPVNLTDVFQLPRKFRGLFPFFMIQPHYATRLKSFDFHDDSSPSRFPKNSFRKLLFITILCGFWSCFWSCFHFSFLFPIEILDTMVAIKYWICSSEIVSSLVPRHRLHFQYCSLLGSV